MSKSSKNNAERTAEERADKVIAEMGRAFTVNREDYQWLVKQFQEAADRARKEGFEQAKEMSAEIFQCWIDNECVGPNPAMKVRALTPPREEV